MKSMISAILPLAVIGLGLPARAVAQDEETAARVIAAVAASAPDARGASVSEVAPRLKEALPGDGPERAVAADQGRGGRGGGGQGGGRGGGQGGGSAGRPGNRGGGPGSPRAGGGRPGSPPRPPGAAYRNPGPANRSNVYIYGGPRYARPLYSYPPAYYDRWARGYYGWSPLAYAPWAWIYGTAGYASFGFSYGPSAYGAYRYPYAYNTYGGAYYPYQGYGAGPYSGLNLALDSGSVRLKVRPRDAEVFVDGYYAGLVDEFDGSFQSLKLQQGGHKIEVRMPGFETLEFDVHVQEDKTIVLQGDLRPRP